MTFSEIYEKADVRRLPVNPVATAAALGIKVIDYKAAASFLEIDIKELYAVCPLGFCFKDGDIYCVALNENACGERRRRFTAAHELAHCVLGHTDIPEITPCEERAAEIFAAELLAPAIVLHKCQAHSPEEISRLCGISGKAAAICARRLAKRERGGFRPSADEIKVAELFADYIGITKAVTSSKPSYRPIYCYR